MPLRLLLAGFPAAAASAPTAGLTRNTASAGLLESCRRREAAAGHAGEGVVLGVHLDVLVLPFSYAGAARALQDALGGGAYDEFLLLGTDAGSSDHKLHVLAANYADHPQPDADGTVLRDEIIDPDGPVAYRSRLPLDGIWDKFLVERVPVRMSHKADLGLFNHAYYSAMRAIDISGAGTRGGALETPPAPGDERDGAEPRVPEALEDELLMVLSVLAQLHPAAAAE